MGTTQLLDKIRADASGRVETISTERDRQVAEINERRDHEIAELRREFGARVENETRLIKDRATSRARLERRKSLLAAKWSVIEQVFALARDRIRDSSDYDSIIDSLVTRHSSGGGVLRFSEVDAGRFRKRYGDRVGEALGIKAGVVIEHARKFLDFSVEESLAAIRAELAPKLDSVLFPRDGVR